MAFNPVRRDSSADASPTNSLEQGRFRYADRFDGGSGTDLANYYDAAADVVVDLPKDLSRASRMRLNGVSIAL
ncbi:hypothetical protein CN116_02920 [Sinorhizobium meliloti]|nr:hypothetical protein CN125_12030 [Sinorhizobium meliloti]RVM50707.1 hypothetical protein CN121_05330 [Sinorhizobium meliloti]RVM67779.1 hypothetical protein CN124_11315 [Sinorhizobium meliloti]RVM72103.1 hypothetical protein CN123_04845 [Sinorhizobium meliloti]RVM87940.1 hypothetical protein CN117_04005 [Sinorhizobium meliloti]